MVFFLGAFSRAEAGTFKGDYFNDINLSAAYLSSYTSNDGTINFDWGSSGPQPNSGSSGYMNSTNYSVRWTGWIDCPTTGNYTFEVRSDDGARLYLDNSSTALINDWSGHPATTSSASVSLVQGAHRLRLEYFQSFAPFAEISLRWKVPGYVPTTVNGVPAAPPLLPATDTPTKIWSVETGVTGGAWVSPSGAGNTVGTEANPIYLDEGEQRLLELTPFSDVDRWRQGAVETGLESETVTTYWSATDGRLALPQDASSRGPSRLFTAPNLFEGQTFRVVDISFYALDAAGGFNFQDQGTRRDIISNETIAGKIRVIVHQKVWGEATTIGIASNDGTRKDGRLLSPIDTRGGSTKPTYAAPNGIVPCQVETATDLDTVTYYPDTTYPNTPIPDTNYVWTTTSGTFRVQTGPDTYTFSTSVTGKRAYFVAPPATGGATVTATIKCTITDPLVVVKPDSGNRTDAPLIRTQQIIVPSSTVGLATLMSSAPARTDSTTLQQFPEQFAKRLTLGGTVYPTAYVTVGQGMRVASNFGTLRFEELPDSTLSAQHSFETNHVDFYLCFYQAGGWEKLYDPDGAGPKQLDWWLSPEAPQSANSADSPVQYRYRFTLNTAQATNTPYVFPNQPTSTLLGHNGAHRLSYLCSDVDPAKPQLEFTSAYGGSYLDGTGALGVSLKNLLIQSVTPNEQFLVAKDATTPATFQVTLDDSEAGAIYNVTVTIRRTVDPTQIIRTLNESSAGLTHTLSWDYSNDDGDFENIEGGYFTFDVAVSKAGDVEQKYRSSFLQVTRDDIYLDSNAAGDFLRDASNRYKGVFKYELNEAPKASSGSISFYQELSPLSQTTGLGDQKRWDTPVETWVSLVDPPTIRGIMQARDTHAAGYRNHQAKPMLNWNTGFSAYNKQSAFTLTLTGGQNAPFVEWQRFVHYFPNSSTVPFVYTPWKKFTVPAWATNSGPGTDLNNSTPSLTWSEDGAIPLSNPKIGANNNNVKDNVDNHWIIAMGSTLGGLISEDSQDSNPASYYYKEHFFFWYDKGEQKRFLANGNPDANGTYFRSNRFMIMNGLGKNVSQQQSGGDADVHIPKVSVPGAEPREVKRGSTIWRQTLRVHDDGVNPGSQGCSAIAGGQMQDVWNRLRTIQRAKDRLDPTQGEWMPFEVYDQVGVPASGPTASVSYYGSP